MNPPETLKNEWCTTHGHVCEDCTESCPIETHEYVLKTQRDVARSRAEMAEMNLGIRERQIDAYIEAGCALRAELARKTEALEYARRGLDNAAMGLRSHDCRSYGDKRCVGCQYEDETKNFIATIDAALAEPRAGG